MKTKNKIRIYSILFSSCMGFLSLHLLDLHKIDNSLILSSIIGIMIYSGIQIYLLFSEYIREIKDEVKEK